MSNYEKIRDTLKTGDIVLFSGKGAFSSTIKWFTKSEFSHVGMVVVLEGYDSVMIWESTTLSNITDLDTGTLRQGVQLGYLSERIDKYDGEIKIRKLSVKPSRAQIDKLSKLRAKLKGKPYEKSKIELIKSAYDGVLGSNKEDISSLFCSELVAEAYYSMGLLSKPPASNEYTPADWSSQNKDIPLLNCSLKKEYKIK